MGAAPSGRPVRRGRDPACPAGGIMTFRKSMASFVALQGLAALLVAGPSFAGGGPTVSPNVQVNDPQGVFPADLPSRNTTTLAAGEEGDNLLAGWDDFQGFCGVFRPC